MNYEEMSDFEINKAVERATGMYCEDFKGRYMPTMAYCGNPSDAWPVIEANGIGMYKAGDCWICGTNISYGNFDNETCHENPLRAAMIVFLMIKDATNAS